MDGDDNHDHDERHHDQNDHDYDHHSYQFKKTWAREHKYIHCAYWNPNDSAVNRFPGIANKPCRQIWHLPSP